MRKESFLQVQGVFALSNAAKYSDFLEDHRESVFGTNSPSEAHMWIVNNGTEHACPLPKTRLCEIMRLNVVNIIYTMLSAGINR